MTLEEVPHEPQFKDCKTRLTVFGILQIILGSFAAMLVPMMIMGSIVSRVAADETGPPVQTRQMIFGILFYIAAAAWFITVGAGSTKARRWARALILVTSWIWLIGGALGFVFILFIMPGLSEHFGANEDVPAAAATMILTVMGIFMAVFYILIPALLVGFYSGRNVKLTCEHYDPKPRWTDACPLPVLGVSLMLLLGVLSAPSLAISNWVLPFFGTLLSGVGGAAVIIPGCVLLALAGWRIYRLDIKGWWLALLLIIGWGVSAFITFSVVSPQAYYQVAGYTAEQLESFKHMQFMLPGMMKWGILMWSLIITGYLIGIKKYFEINGPGDDIQTVNQFDGTADIA